MCCGNDQLAQIKFRQVSNHFPVQKRLTRSGGLPIIGSVHEIPEKLGWIKFADWGKEYGPIYQTNLAGNNHVWISTDEVARDLLSKKSAIYSNRPHIPALIDDNRSSAQYLPLLTRNDSWNRQRKFASHIMRDSEKHSFHHYPELESIRLCKELMDDPLRYNHALESFISRVTCRLAWGHSEAADELKQRARELLIGVSPTGALGNKLPFVMALPDWLSPAKAWERRRAKTERKFFQIMQSTVLREMDERRAAPSWTKLFYDDPKRHGFTGELEGAYAVGMHGIAGALTIAAPMQSFLLAMCHYPQYLPMLQEELDRVCGDRLPTNADKPNLPFLRACIRESIRWRPPVPTGIPHALAEDDEYNGHFIPKGSVIHPLEWSICRDPSIFPEPNEFNPLRWVKPEYPTYKEPLTQYPILLNMTQFGYGRRICQGQTVAEADMCAGIAAMAWLFDISKADTGLSTDDSEDLTGSESETNEQATIKPVKELHPMGNNKATISSEELNTGLSAHSSDDEDADVLSIRQRLSVPGSFPHPTEQELRDAALATRQKKREARLRAKAQAEDPTLIFTTLLIAKPLPFKFSMKIRSEKRAAYIRQLFEEKRSMGEFVPEAEYWGSDHGKGQELGWNKV
ncbi:cytochrome P450 2E1 [Eremomyces bilateralis CBS 781.70]|uniref:Cytochrome P450 2E1 n=1 Tax=Eremomyces bilateralis CBS 781.70 TaxID=1392243 RepID=A0A6G1GC37_9PEZI|nr:cytochrome P450 2E1 [Eremomyces bilateralis CBS 781.70]KAF1815461.1 cytochrome P450 2E1 [Eremomyces bilateralis CBS 781.70]